MIRVKAPAGPIIDAAKMRRAIRNAMTAAAKGAKVDFDVTTQTWEHRPDFDIDEQAPETREIATESEIYGYIDDGTKPHDIAPRQAPRLVFPGGAFKAKTRPGVIASGPGGGGDGSMIFLRKGQVVHHPGTKARDFSEVIANKWERRLADILQRAIDEALL